MRPVQNCASEFYSIPTKSQGCCGGFQQKYPKILMGTVQGTKQWHEKMPFKILGYRTIVHTLIGENPYLLVYGTEVVIPAEVEISSLRIYRQDGN